MYVLNVVCSDWTLLCHGEVVCNSCDKEPVVCTEYRVHLHTEHLQR